MQTSSEPAASETAALLGKPLADRVMRGVRADLKAWAQLDPPFEPQLVSVLASDDEASQVYVQSKAKRAKKLGVAFRVVDLGARATQEALEQTLRELSADPAVHGIVLELPLAAGLDADAALLHIAARKDIEGLSPANLALIAAGREPEALLPPTPRSVRFLLRHALGDDLRGLRVASTHPDFFTFGGGAATPLTPVSPAASENCSAYRTLATPPGGDTPLSVSPADAQEVREPADVGGGSMSTSSSASSLYPHSYVLVLIASSSYPHPYSLVLISSSL